MGKEAGKGPGEGTPLRKVSNTSYFDLSHFSEVRGRRSGRSVRRTSVHGESGPQHLKYADGRDSVEPLTPRDGRRPTNQRGRRYGPRKEKGARPRMEASATGEAKRCAVHFTRANTRCRARFDQRLHRQCNIIERAVGHLKDTRHRHSLRQARRQLLGHGCRWRIAPATKSMIRASRPAS